MSSVDVGSVVGRNAISNRNVASACIERCSCIPCLFWRYALQCPEVNDVNAQKDPTHLWFDK